MSSSWAGLSNSLSNSLSWRIFISAPLGLWPFPFSLKIWQNRHFSPIIFFISPMYFQSCSSLGAVCQRKGGATHCHCPAVGAAPVPAGTVAAAITPMLASRRFGLPCTWSSLILPNIYRENHFLNNWVFRKKIVSQSWVWLKQTFL